MRIKVEIGTGMYPFKLFETYGEIKFNIGGSIGIMGQFIMVVKTIFLCRNAH